MKMSALRKMNRRLSAIGIKPLTVQEYVKMIGAADASHDHPNGWNSYERPWPIHHMTIGQIYMYVEEHPDGIKATFSLPACTDENAAGRITGCVSVDEAKHALTYSILKAATVDQRYAAAFAALVKAKVASMGSASPEDMQKSLTAILMPISGETAEINLPIS